MTPLKKGELESKLMDSNTSGFNFFCCIVDRN